MDFEQETSSLRYYIALLSVMLKESIDVEFYDHYWKKIVRIWPLFTLRLQIWTHSGLKSLFQLALS